MSFRQVGGLKYSSKHNMVSSNYNTTNNLIVTQNAGISDNLKVTNNLEVYGDSDISGNLTAYNMYLSSGDNYGTQPNSVVPKAYVDAFVTGLNIKQPVVCISTFDNSANTTTYPVPIYPNTVDPIFDPVFDTIFTIDGVSIKVNDSVLLNDQGFYSKIASVDNGVYDFSYNGLDYYFIRTTNTQSLYLGSDAKAAYIKASNGTTDGGSSWVQTNSPAIVGTDPLLFYPFNPASGSSYTPGIGLYASQEGTKTYLNVDSNLNFLTTINASGGETLDIATQSSQLNLGSTGTSVNIASNSYVYTPYSIGSTFSPQTVQITANTASTQITFTWSIPNNSGNPLNIPESIQSVNATLYANISGTVKTYSILSQNTQNITKLNKINITNQQSSNGFSDGGSTYNFYSSDFTNMVDSTENQLILWYTNYSPYPNVSYVGYSSFTAIGVPGPVFFNTASQNNYNSVTLQCYVKLTDEMNGSTGPPYITNYKIPTNGYSTSGSTQRYGGPIGFTGNSSDLILNGLSKAAYDPTDFILNNIHPDSNYNFNVQASNDNGSTYGTTGTYNFTTVPPDYPSPTIPSNLFDITTGVTGYANPNASNFCFASNSSIVKGTIINTNYVNNWTSNPIITSVQTSANYGSTSANMLDISCNISHIINNAPPPSTIICSFSVGGFGQTSSGTTSNSGIQINYKNYDNYINSNDYNQGFYLDCSTNALITQTYFQTPNYMNDTSYNIVLTTKQKNQTGTLNTNSSSYTFYANNLNTNPSYVSISEFIINPNIDNKYYSSQISGIWVLTLNPTFSITNLKLNNMGDYFYASPLVKYDMSGGAITSSVETSTGSLTNPLIITNTGVSGTLENSQRYSTIKLSLKNINNIYGSSSATNIATINVIVDYPSYQLINSYINASISLTTTGNYGYRVWSANPVNTIIPSGYVPYIYIKANTSIPNNTATGSNTTATDTGYISVPYNNVWNISTNSNTNEELLIANGGFTTDSQYYKNYGTDFSGNGQLNNGIDYSLLTGTKYATFAWNISSNLTGYTYVIFNIVGSSNFYYLSTTSSFYFDSNCTVPLYLFFRFEYKTSLTTWGTFGNNSFYPNTVWICCNANGPLGNTYTNTQTVCDLNNAGNNFYYNGGTKSPMTPSKNINVTVQIPSGLYINTNSILYLRVGIPNGQTTLITGIKAYVSN